MSPSPRVLKMLKGTGLPAICHTDAGWPHDGELNFYAVQSRNHGNKIHSESSALMAKSSSCLALASGFYSPKVSGLES